MTHGGLNGHFFRVSVVVQIGKQLTPPVVNDPSRPFVTDAPSGDEMKFGKLAAEAKGSSAARMGVIGPTRVITS